MQPPLQSSTPALLAALLLLGAARGQGGGGIGGVVVKRWPLEAPMPIEPRGDIDGSSAGPAGIVTVTEHHAGTCHEEVCNCFKSIEPHVFHITWCASTVGNASVGCSLDVGYRSGAGARSGRLGWSVGGWNASAASFTYVPADAVFRAPATSAWPFDNMAAPSGKNVIDTVYSALGPADGTGDNLPLSATSGFCCRAEFSGGGTVTGTIYVGDLEVRAGAAAPSATPSVTPSVTPTPSTSPTASRTASQSATPSPSLSAAPPAAAAAGPDLGGSYLSAPAQSFLVLGAALAGSAATLVAQLVMRRLRGDGGALELRGGGGGPGGAGGAAARERAALLGRAGK